MTSTFTTAAAASGPPSGRNSRPSAWPMVNRPHRPAGWFDNQEPPGSDRLDSCPPSSPGPCAAAGRTTRSTPGAGVVGDLAEAVQVLAYLHVKSPALIVRRPDGGYAISTDGVDPGSGDRRVISRSQLADLMWEHGFRRDALADPQQAARLAAVVAALHQPHGRADGHGDL